MNLKFKIKCIFSCGTTRKTISALHLTQTILKAEKNSPVLYLNQSIQKLKTLKKKGILLSEKTRENNLCIAFDSKHKNQKRTLCAAFKPNHKKI